MQCYILTNSRSKTKEEKKNVRNSQSFASAAWFLVWHSNDAAKKNGFEKCDGGKKEKRQRDPHTDNKKSSDGK